MSLRSSVGKFHHCVVVNQAQKDLLLEMGVEDQRVSVVPCGASVDEPANAAPVRTASRVRFIGVSRLVEKKGVDCTLRAFKQVVDRFPDCELMLVGDGPARSMLEKLTAELDIKDKVKFAGSIPNVKVRACLVSAHIFVQHSVVARDGNKEGSSVAVAEAAACGLPVITTLGSGGMEELVRHGETGFLVGQREVQEMAERMLELATDAELRGRFGRAARCHIMENFNVRRQVDKLEDVLLKYCKRDRVS